MKEPKNNTCSSEIEQGATVVVTHRVQHEQQANYEQWLREVLPLCKSYPGHLDLQIIRPIAGLTSTYTIVIRFDTCEHLHQWINSKDRKSFIAKAQPLLSTGDELHIKSGLDFWFTPETAKAKLPTQWKQFLITWTAIVPLNILAAVFLIPLLNQTSVGNVIWLRVTVVSGIVVFFMVYIVMPRYTKLVQRWLFKSR